MAQAAAKMTDEQLAAYLGLTLDPARDQILANITPEARAVYERMAEVETEIALWQQGLAPKPTGVILCAPGKQTS